MNHNLTCYFGSKQISEKHMDRKTEKPNKNAFNVLMSSASKRDQKPSPKKSFTSNKKAKKNTFGAASTKRVTPKKLSYCNDTRNKEINEYSPKHVACPVCNERIKATLINDHLDLNKCSLANSSNNEAISSSNSAMKRSFNNAFKQQEKDEKSRKRIHVEQIICDEEESCLKKVDTPSKAPTTVPNANTNAFAHMMNHAKIFATKAKSFIFHLDNNNEKVTWISSSDLEKKNKMEGCQKWRSTVKIKGSDNGVTHELIMSSTIPSATNECSSDDQGIFKMDPLVKRHSKLSVSFCLYFTIKTVLWLTSYADYRMK